MSLFSGLERGAVRRDRRGNYSIHAVSVNVDRGGGLVVAGFASVGVFVGSYSRDYSRDFSLYVYVGLVRAYFLCVRSLASR